MKVKKLNYTDEFEFVKVPFLDPDKLITYIIEAGLKIPQEEVEHFWSRKRANKEEWAIKSPATPKHIPVAIYGDAARLYTAQRESKYLGIFISLPLWRPRSSRFGRWCIFSLENAKLYGCHTLHPVLSRITYKLNMLFENGVVGSDGVIYKFACTEIRGDWEWHKQLFSLASSWKSIANVCFRCQCVARSDDPKQLYYCTDDNTNWKHFGLVDFLASQIREYPSCPLTLFSKKRINSSVFRWAGGM